MNISEKISEIATEFPKLRVGSILQSAVDIRKKQKNFDISDITDKEIMTALKEYHNRLRGGN